MYRKILNDELLLSVNDLKLLRGWPLKQDNDPEHSQGHRIVVSQEEGKGNEVAKSITRPKSY